MAGKTPSHALHDSRSVAPPLAATFAALGLFGATAWADEPNPAPPAAPESPEAASLPDPNKTGAKPKSGLERWSEPAYVFGETTAATTGNNGGANAAGTGNGGGLLGSWLGRFLTITGGSSLSYRANSITGGSAAQSYYLDEFDNSFDARRIGPFQNSMDLTVQGKLFNLWNINAHLTNSRYSNYVNQSFGFNFKSKGTTLDVGDVNATLPGNSLVTFSKSLQGLVFGRDFGGGRVRVTGIASITRAVTRRGSFRGQDSSGPYFLSGGYILEGSERLRVDGREVRRAAAVDEAAADGLVYSIDYFTGQIHFNRIIPSASTVEYSYESRSVNTTPGLLLGQRLDLVLGAGNTMGVTWLQQKSTGGGGGSVESVERFPVVDNPTFLYVLSSLIDTAFPIEVRWLGQATPFVENIDYEVLPAQHAIRLKRVLPPDTSLTGVSSLRVTYRPIRTAAVGGDRSIMGLDTNLRLGGSGDLQLQFGRSQSPDGTGTGQGMTATANLRGGGRSGWTLATSWRDIGAGFSTIDSVGGAFLRAEKGLSSNLTFTPSPYVNFSAGLIRSRIAQPNYLIGGGTSTDVSSLTWATNQSWNARMALNLPRLPTFEFFHNQVAQVTGASSRSAFSQSGLNMNWQRGILSLNGALGRTQSRGRTVFSGYGAGYGAGGVGTGSLLGDYRNGLYDATANDSTTTTSSLGVQLTPAPWISLTGNIGIGRTKFGSSSTASVSNSSAKSRDLSYGFTLTPLRDAGRLTIQANFSDTSNGQSTAAFYNPLTGTTGTGTTGTTGTGTIANGSFLPPVVSGQRTRQSQVSLQFTPWSNLTLNFGLNRSLSLVPGYDNTESTSNQMEISYAPWAKLQLSGQLLDQKVSYVGNQGNSNSRSYLLSSTMGPFGKLTFSTSLQRMNTGSALYYGGEIPGIGGSGGGTGLGGLGTGTTTTAGSFAQRQNMTILATRMDYPLGGGRTLFLQWQSLASRNPGGVTDTYAGTGYRASYNSKRSVGTLGMDFKLNEILGFTVDMNLIRLDDHDNPDYSYKARTMSADLSARF